MNPANPTNDFTLTSQEISVMQLVAEGKANSAIARQTFASEKTVERVLSRVYLKYGISGTSKSENPRVKATLIYRGWVN